MEEILEVVTRMDGQMADILKAVTRMIPAILVLQLIFFIWLVRTLLRVLRNQQELSDFVAETQKEVGAALGKISHDKKQ